MLQYDALYLSRFMHALFGPETALAYLQQLIPIVAGNPELLLSWASCKLSTDESIEVIERLEAFLETQSDNKSPSIQRAHAYLGRAYLIQVQPELASKHFAFLEKRMPQLSTQETPHYVFATAEVYFALGKQAAFHGVDEMAEALLIQTVIAYCWGDLPVVVKTQPGIPFGNAQMEETGRHYPWLVRLMEAVWELVEFYERLSLYQEAYALAREGTRLALSMPWGYALDHLFLLVKLSCLVGNKLNAEQVRQVLARGEPLFEQPPMRSKLAETFLLSDRKIAREQLVKLAHAYRRAKAPKWAAEAQTLAEHPLVGLDSDCDPVPLEKQGPFLNARLALERWQDHLGLSGFLSDDHPLPDPLPW
ncbi:MAG: hypothetical protein HUU38_07995 [Anaerolineales bacterium]|nr:hypothetical protein [Anaerolineales bacterium]